MSHPVCRSGHAALGFGQVRRHAVVERVLDRAGQVGPHRPVDHRSQPSGQLVDAGPERGDRGRQVDGWAAVPQEPQDTALHHAPKTEKQLDLHVGVDRSLERVDAAPPRAETVHVGGHHVGPGDVGHPGTGLVGHAEVERRAGHVDHLVGQHGGDDVPPQPVSTHDRGEAILAKRSGSSGAARAGRRDRRAGPRPARRRRWCPSCRRGAPRTRAWSGPGRRWPARTAACRWAGTRAPG